MNSIDESIQRLLAAGVVANHTMLGCDESHIREIEDSIKIRLPENYRHFLKIAGHKAGMFMEGSDYCCDKLLTINADAADLLAESESAYTLQKTDFVFLMNQGYEFLFFEVGVAQQANKVYKYEQGEEHPEQVADSFEEWFALACDDEIEAYEDLRQS